MLKITLGGGPGSLEQRVQTLTELAGGRIPLADGMVPRVVTCHFSELTLGVGQTLRLPTAALPLASQTQITWSSGDSGILQIGTDGQLAALAAGHTELIRTCPNFDDLHIPVTVRTEPVGCIALPDALNTLEMQALDGLPALYVQVTASLTDFSTESFDENMILLFVTPCAASDAAEAWGLSYILQGSSAEGS